jgi:hypothetical protein
MHRRCRFQHFLRPIYEQLTSTAQDPPIHPSVSEMKSDRGTEFLNDDMEDLLGNHAIFHSTSSPHSPHQNGINDAPPNRPFETTCDTLGNKMYKRRCF